MGAPGFFSSSNLLWLFCVCALSFLVATSGADDEHSTGEPIDWRVTGKEVEPGSFEPAGDLRIQLPGARNRVSVGTLPDGSTGYLVRLPAGQSDRILRQDEFLSILQDTASMRRGWFDVLNISSPAGVAWVVLGLAGQMLFALRMLVQWMVSEKEKRSVVPVVFWWFSLGGATLLLAYFIWRQDLVGILGQLTGWLIYLRNIWLIYRNKFRARQQAVPS